MPDSSNQKALREFCTLTGCEVWKAIQALESPGLPADGRSELRKFCADGCAAYRFCRFLDGGNFEIKRRAGYGQYHSAPRQGRGKRT